MDMYKGLVKQRVKAVGIFNKVLTKLYAVSEKLTAEANAAQSRIESHEAAVAREKDAIHFLAGELQTTQKTIDQIASITGGTP